MTQATEFLPDGRLADPRRRRLAALGAASYTAVGFATLAVVLQVSLAWRPPPAPIEAFDAPAWFDCPFEVVLTDWRAVGARPGRLWARFDTDGIGAATFLRQCAGALPVEPGPGAWSADAPGWWAPERDPTCEHGARRGLRVQICPTPGGYRVHAQRVMPASPNPP